MFIWLAIKRNKRLAQRHGWEPKWFNATGFNKELVKNIKQFQKKHGIKANGVCGSRTYRLILLKVLLEIKDRKH